jgi:prolyl-tRNA synthetase
MRRTHLFLPTLKENPTEAQIVSHRLMMRAGMVRQSTAGIYSWLPMGYRVLKKISDIVRQEQDYTGAQEILMPTIQSADLWRKSERYEDYGKEMLRITDRHNREMLYGPTNEELITDIVSKDINSYKDLPKNLYHIQWKFRDEVRPRFGVMRGREFLMKDNYSFDLNYQSAKHSYNKMFICYLRTFSRLGLKAIPMSADTGPIGGNLSHEFIILADTGESEVFCDRRLLDIEIPGRDTDYESDLQGMVDNWTCYYAATDEKHEPDQCPITDEDLIKARGIEVGHIFYFGTKYSEKMNAFVQDSEGNKTAIEMGSYGIGVSRLVGAIIESSHDEKGIIWPESIAPWNIGLINLKTEDLECEGVCEKIYADCNRYSVDILYDDRNERAGTKFAEMDLIGLPWQIIVGPRGLKEGVVELKCRADGESRQMSIEGIQEWIKGRVFCDK